MTHLTGKDSKKRPIENGIASIGIFKPNEFGLGFMAGVPPAQNLLLENRRTRVWEMVLEPGQDYPLHAHEHPYLSLTLEGASLVMTAEDNSEEPFDTTAGDVFWFEPPDTHAVRNVGTTRYRNRVVEFIADSR